MAEQRRPASRSRTAAAIAAMTLTVTLTASPAQAVPPPHAASASQQEADHTAVTGLSYAELPGNAGTVDLYLPRNAEGPTPVVLWTRGSAWLADNGNDGGEAVARELTEHGYAVAAVAIRSSGQAPFPAQVHDAKAAVRWLRTHAETYNLDGDRIAAMGNSSGGWTATMLGVTSNDPALEGAVGTTGPSSAVQAVVDLYGPTDFLRMNEQMLPGACDLFNAMLGVSGCHDDPLSPESRLIGAPIQDSPELATAANPITYVDGDTPPFLVAHGTEDQLVPHDQSVLLFDALARAQVPATFYSVDGYGHNHGFLDETRKFTTRTVHRVKPNGGTVTSSGAPLTWDAVVRFLDKQLGRG